MCRRASSASAAAPVVASRQSDDSQCSHTRVGRGDAREVQRESGGGEGGGGLQPVCACVLVCLIPVCALSKKF